MADNKLSKKGERHISPFVGQELLYDYVSLKLDSERKKAIEELLKNSREAQDEIRKLNNALTYLSFISETKVSDLLVEQVKTPVSYFQAFLFKIRFQQWPPGVRLALESLLVVLCIVIISFSMPWHKLSNLDLFHSQEVTLFQVENKFEVNDEPEIATNPKGNDAAVTFSDENENASALVTTPVAVPEKPKVAVQVPAKKTEVTEFKTTGFLMRGSISVVNLKVTSEKFVQKINELGGRKAGEVELGWKKGNGTYFHFTMPENKYQDLQTYLAKYGNLKIQKEKHDRIMPEGIIRLIITVDERKEK